MSNQTLRYYMHDGPAAFRFELAGEIDKDGARRLHQDWRTASSVIGGRALIVDMTFVTSMDEAGRNLLVRWHAEGAQFIARSEHSRELVESMLGEIPPAVALVEDATADQTWLPFYTSFGKAKLHLAVLIAALLLPAQAHAASLKAETAAAWDDYVQKVGAGMQDRTRPGGCFLWTDEDPERMAKVHRGEIVVIPAPGPSPRRVPGGLIHHWIGGAFLADRKLDEILAVTRDYDRYKEFYRPSVIESKTLARDASEDKFSMLLMNQAFLLKTALDADYHLTNVRLDDRRFYSVSRTTRVQEIEDYGRPTQRLLREGEGGGYIWKLFTIVRLEQRAEGVHVEMETVALSREIPGAVRVVVDPIIRRVSRDAMLTSIKQTEEAVRWNSRGRVKSAGSSASAEHASNAAEALKSGSSAFARVK
jgi:hypothetical protein